MYLFLFLKKWPYFSTLSVGGLIPQSLPIIYCLPSPLSSMYSFSVRVIHRKSHRPLSIFISELFLKFWKKDYSSNKVLIKNVSFISVEPGLISRSTFFIYCLPLMHSQSEIFTEKLFPDVLIATNHQEYICLTKDLLI